MASIIGEHSVIDPSARIDDDVEIGPFCVVGPDVTIGRGTRLMNNVTITGHVTIGEFNQFYPGVVIGGEPFEVTFDFAVSLLPGWHTTIFPPYFVAGAIFSGFAMVVTLIIPTRKVFHLEEIITARHLENMAKIMLVTGMIQRRKHFAGEFCGLLQNGLDQIGSGVLEARQRGDRL